MAIPGLEPQVNISDNTVKQISKNSIGFSHFLKIIVTGDANFSMKSTSLTVGGFNQPGFARFLIELPGNAEKGLSQRFLWFFPRPVYSHFATLEPVKKEFTEKIGMPALFLLFLYLVYNLSSFTHKIKFMCPFYSCYTG